MRSTALLLCLGSLALLPPRAARAEEMADEVTGLRIAVPDGWARDLALERGATKFAARHVLAHGKVVRMLVEALPAPAFEGKRWLAGREHALMRHLDRITSAFRPETTAEIGGAPATGFTCAGVTEAGEGGEPPVLLHYRGRAVLRDGIFVQATQVSTNGAEVEAAEAIGRMWENILFQEGCGCDEGCGCEEPCGCEDGCAETPAPEAPKAPGLATGKPREYKDEEGNYTITFPDSWVVTHEGAAGAVQRLQIRARATDGSDLLAVEFWKVEVSDASTFATDTPTDVLKRLDQNEGFFMQFYGEGSRGQLSPKVDESVLLGGAEKSGNYEYRGLTTDQIRETRETEDKIRRGDKTAKMPEFKETVVRGRIALISPNIYIVRAHFRPDVSDEPELVAAYKQVVDSFQFITSGAKPPAYTYVTHDGQQVRLEDTLNDPANKEARKHSTSKTDTGRKAYTLEVEFVIPPGFVHLTDKIKSGHTIILAAQDAHNNWIDIKVSNASLRAVGDQNKVFQDKKVDFETWKSNWVNQARGAKFPAKPQKVRIGTISGDGWDEIAGDVDKFHGTFTGLLTEGKGWRTRIEVETRGKGDKVFAEGLKMFGKSLKLKS